VNADGFNSASRFALGCALVWVLNSLAVNLFNFGSLFLLKANRTQVADAVRYQKLRAPRLESLLREGKVVPPDSQLHCRPAAQDWDYLCSYMPTPTQSHTRVRFGIIVDSVRWVEVSRIVPMSADVPPPRRR
jgi:hypothetical protein